MRANINAGSMQQTYHLPIDRRILRRVSVVAVIHLGPILAPLLIHPSSAATATAVHVELGAAGDQPPATQRLWRSRQRLDGLECLPRGLYAVAGMPEHAHMNGERSRLEKLAVGVPHGLGVIRVLNCRHALAVQRLDHRKNPLPPLFLRWLRNQVGHESLSALLQDPRGCTGGVMLNGPGRRIRRACRHFPQPQRIVIRNPVVSRGLPQPNGVIRSRCIEIRCQHISVLVELCFVPSLTSDPVTGLELRRFVPHSLHNLRNTRRRAKIDSNNPCESSVGNMRVRVD